MTPHRPPHRIRRRAFTLVEVLIFMAIMVILIVVAWRVLSGGIHTGRTAVEGLALQQGIRNLMENFTRDVNGTMLIHTPHAETAFPNGDQVITIDLFQHSNMDPGLRKEHEWQSRQGGRVTNSDSPYPFGRTGGDNRYGLPVLHVVYQWDRTKQTVTRAVRSGTLEYVTSRDEPLNVSYNFEPDQGSSRTPVRRPPTVLARKVEVFEVAPIALNYNELEPITNRPKMVLTGSLPGDGQKMDRTIGLALRVKADFREGDDDVPMGEDSSMEILTKVFSYLKIADMQYGSYFSSVDADLRY